MNRLLPALSIALASGAARAHGGYGLEGAHWHATDTFGVLLVGALAALAIWLGRK